MTGEARRPSAKGLKLVMSADPSYGIPGDGADRWRRLPGDKHTMFGALSAEPCSVPEARARCADFAKSVGASVSVVESIAVAVSEAVTNAVLYAYPGAQDGPVRITASVDRDARLQIVVTDDGVGIANGERSDGLGCRLTIIERLADELQIDTSDRTGTSVQIVFVLD